MSDPSKIRDVVNRFIEAINDADPDRAPLAPDIVRCGPMMPEPLCGAPAVRRFLGEIAPFIDHLRVQKAVFEGDSAALLFELRALNGTVIEGAEFFVIRDGLICEDRVFFDTRALLHPSG